MQRIYRYIAQLGACTLLVTGTAAAQGSAKASRLAAPTNIVIRHSPTAIAIDWTTVVGATTYVINQRQVGSSVITPLITIPTPTYFGPLPAAGVAFEYQVVAVEKNTQAPSPWVAYTVPVPTPTSIASPAWLTATGVGIWTMTGQCEVKWAQVANTAKYQVLRSSKLQPETIVAEVFASAQPADSYSETVNASDAWGYRVVAVLASGIKSSPSPGATCKPPVNPPPGSAPGPAWLIATGVGIWGATAQCAVQWATVANAAKYLVLRASRVETERVIAEVFASTQPADRIIDTAANDLWGYRVYAVLTNGAATAASPGGICKPPN